MAEIKPAEISAILKKQVEGFESGATLEEVGSVLQVGDGIARVYGLSTHSTVSLSSSTTVWKGSY
jgi:F-type H+-transporting ATPase subunit alpha